MTSRMEEIAERFRRDTADHQMTVLLDQGVYRHLRFRKDNRWMYGFDIITTPHVLVMTGDMGELMFVRLDEDPFRHFRGTYLSYDYWSQKLSEAMRDGCRRYSEEVFKSFVRWYVAEMEDPGLAEDVETTLLCPPLPYDGEEACRALDDYRYDGFRFDDFSMADLEEWTTRYLWGCHAIQQAIQQYDQKTDEETVHPDYATLLKANEQLRETLNRVSSVAVNAVEEDYYSLIGKTGALREIAKLTGITWDVQTEEEK